MKQTKIERLDNLNYDVAEGADRAMLSEGNLRDLIALSEEVAFDMNEQGSQCLFFRSTTLKSYQERAFGSGSKNIFDPYCDDGDGFRSSNAIVSDDTYTKNEILDLIENFTKEEN